MRNVLKKIISFFLVLCIFISSVLFCYVNTYADVWHDVGQGYGLGKIFETWEDPNKSVLDKIIDTFHYGFYGMVPSSDWLNRPTPLQAAQEELDKKVAEDTGKDQSEITEDDRKQWFNQNVSIVNNRMITTNNFNTVIKNYSNYIINHSQYYYAYTKQVEMYATLFPDGDMYRIFRNFIKEHQDSYRVNLLCFWRSDFDGSEWDYNHNEYCFILFPHNQPIALVEHRALAKEIQTSSYNSTAWVPLNRRDYMNNVGIKLYAYSVQKKELVEKDIFDFCVPLAWQNGHPYGESNRFSGNFSPVPQNVYNEFKNYNLTSGRIDTYKVFRTVDDMKSFNVGHPSYFITNNYTNFINNSGDTYTIDNSNVNKVTYGDIITYIDNHYEDEGDYPTDEDIKKWIDKRNTEPEPTPTPTPTPTPGPDDPILDPDDPTPTPTPTPGPDDYDPWRHTVSGNGTGGDTDDWSFWDFLKGIINFLKGIVEGIGSILSAITDWFTVDTDQIKTHVSGVIDGSVPLPNGVSYNGIVNEIIPVEDIKSIGKTFTDIPDGFVPGTYYPKLTIKTPQIIRQFYDEEEIVLLDFEEWASTFVIVRTLLEFSFWLAEIYYLLSKLRPVITIG